MDSTHKRFIVSDCIHCICFDCIASLHQGEAVEKTERVMEGTTSACRSTAEDHTCFCVCAEKERLVNLKLNYGRIDCWQFPNFAPLLQILCMLYVSKVIT